MNSGVVGGDYGDGKAPGVERCRFIHLNVHSAYSLLEGAIQVERLIDLAIADGQPALAITDRSNMFGALEFSEKSAKFGLQPIMGCKIAVNLDGLHNCVAEIGKNTGVSYQSDGISNSVDGSNSSGFAESQQNFNNATSSVSLSSRSNASHQPTQYPFLNFLAMNQTGFDNLVKLSSRSFLLAKEGEFPHITSDQLVELSEGLLVISGGDEGPVNQFLHKKKREDANKTACLLGQLFNNRFYIELQRHADSYEGLEEQLLNIAYENHFPLVATNQVYFATPEDHEAHDALICIAQGNVVGQDDRRQFSNDYNFKSQVQMVELFQDLPEALDNTVNIARRCAFRTLPKEPILPNYTVEGEKDADGNNQHDLLTAMAQKGLKERLDAHGLAPGFDNEAYQDRLKFELGIIEQMGFPGYFLIVADFINWAKERDIPVGPGRGSGAGSVVAWSLKITDPDPMRFSLLFERFLNPERLSMPDFDIDFCQDRREEVIHYVQEKYGRDQVAHIITFGTLQARAVLRDVGRVLQMPYGQVDRLCKMVPANPANPLTLAQAMEAEPRLGEARKDEAVVDQLFAIAMRLEGLYRHASTHAAGIVIGDRKLEELVPLYRDPRSSMPVSQYNMKWVEPAGLVKFDFLGLKTLTVLKKAVELIRQRDIEIVLDKLPIDDEKTFEMLTRGETTGVFQLESAGMRKALLGMKPDRFEDIIALVALYRPGPMDNIPTYNACKNGEEIPNYYDDKIKHLLDETYGVIIYQEQVLQIARVLSGYSLGEADFLRKAMGKKIKSEMDAQRARFVKGAVEREMSTDKANMIFDVLAKFAGYGFNKAHATAYALISYQTAYLRCHYPIEFLAASMQLDLGNTDKLAIFNQDARQSEIEIVAPNVQLSHAGFSVSDTKIYYGLAAIKGVGEGAVEQIIVERQENGEFKSLTDFFTRVNGRQLNRRTVENLICAGAFDCFGRTREAMLAGLDRLLGHAARTIQDMERGQSDMFGGETAAQIELPAIDAWALSEKLQREHQSLGFYFSAHPLDEFRENLEKMRVQQIGDFENSVRAGALAGRLAGTVVSRQERNSRKGKRFGVVLLSDPSGQYEALIFEENLNRFREMLEAGNSVIILVGAELQPEGVKLIIQNVVSLEEEANRIRMDLRIFIRDESPLDAIASLVKIKGDGTVSLVVVQNNGEQEVDVQLKGKFQVNKPLASAIRALPGVVDAEAI